MTIGWLHTPPISGSINYGLVSSWLCFIYWMAIFYIIVVRICDCIL